MTIIVFQYIIYSFYKRSEFCAKYMDNNRTPYAEI